jgi:hypothetical protein
VDYLLGVSENMTPYLSMADYEREGRKFIYDENVVFGGEQKILNIYASRPWGKHSAKLKPYSTVKLNALYEYLAHSLYVIFVKDDSVNPDFIDNDMVYVEATDERIDGGMYAIRTEADEPGVCLCRCVFRENKIILSPLNSAYMPDIIDMDKCGFNPIAGRPFWLYRETN